MKLHLRRLPNQLFLYAALIILLGLVAYFSPQGKLLQLNRIIQDFSVASHGSAAPDNVVIVAIDNASIKALGRWPWRRAFHAELLNRIAEGHPKVIGLDVLFTEEQQEYPGDDVLLAQALRRNAPVVLPVFIQQEGTQKHVISPINALAQNAASLGQAHIKVDSDGIVRSIYKKLDADGTLWPQFAIALLDTAGTSMQRASPQSGISALNASNESQGHQRNLLVIPFAGPAGHFHRVSYIDVLHGKIHRETFRDKYVLIGATAEGMADLYATPMYGKTHLMPGVEILSNIVNSLDRHRALKTASALQNILLNLTFILIAMTGLMFLRPFRSLLITLGLGTILFAITYTATGTGLLFNPAAGILGLIGIYVVWSLNRLDVATRYLNAELRTLQQQGLIPFSAAAPTFFADFFNRRIAVVEEATRQLQTLHRFVTDAVNTLPYPTFIADAHGIVRIVNSAAGHYMQLPVTAIIGQSLISVMTGVNAIETSSTILPQDMSFNCPDEIAKEAKDSQGRALLVKCIPIYSPTYTHTGWILSLVDISELRAAEAAREEALRFIAHDIRSPLSAIITELDLHRMGADERTLIKRVETYARNALLLADDVLHLSRAQMEHYSFATHDLTDVLLEAVHESWGIAQAAQIKIHVENDAAERLALIDRTLFKRALLNLLSNAIKFSARHSSVSCSITRKDKEWVIAIRDTGLGIDKQSQKFLFQPFRRLHTATHPEISGSGLGLALVKTVIEKHGGCVDWVSTVNIGSTFTLSVPAKND